MVTDECLIALVAAVMGISNPSLSSKIPRRINLINCSSAADNSRPRNNPSMIQSTANEL